MSKLVDYILGQSTGREAELEASLEHALGCLGVEIEDNAKLRAENERLLADNQEIRRINDELRNALHELLSIGSRTVPQIP